MGFTLRNGKVAEFHEYTDTEAAASAYGGYGWRRGLRWADQEFTGLRGTRYIYSLQG
jgi:hypothetical protein